MPAEGAREDASQPEAARSAVARGSRSAEALAGAAAGRPRLFAVDRFRVVASSRRRRLPPLGVVTPSDATNAAVGPVTSGRCGRLVRLPVGAPPLTGPRASAPIGPLLPGQRGGRRTVRCSPAALVLPLVSTDPGTQGTRGDDDRTVDLSDDFVVLPEQTSDDTDRAGASGPAATTTGCSPSAPRTGTDSRLSASRCRRLVVSTRFGVRLPRASFELCGQPRTTIAKRLPSGNPTARCAWSGRSAR